MDTNFNTLCKLCSLSTTAADIEPDGVDWQAVWQLASRHRVVPVIADRLKALNLAIPEDIAKKIAQHNQENLLNGMKQLGELVYLTQLLDKENISFVVFKGIALSHLTGSGLHQRHNGDIDILLARYTDLWKTDALLRKNGYQRTHLPETLELNYYQKKHLMRNGKDIGYQHKVKNIRLELHFKLFPSDIMCSLLPSPEDIHARRTTIPLQKTKLHLMNKEIHLSYLLLHGSISRWFRLKWLCDIPLLSDNGQAYVDHNVLENKKARRMLLQGLYLSKAYLKMPEPYISERDFGKNERFIINLAESCMKNRKTLLEARPRISPELPIYYARLVKYKLILIKGFLYKLNVLRTYSTDYHDWQTLPLPANLFWLYYPLRPILWLKRWL